VEVVSPKGVGPLLAPIVSPRELSGHAPHEPTDFQSILGVDQQVDVV
jgi:hypothetical protein